MASTSKSSASDDEVFLRPGFLPRAEFQRFLDFLGESGYRCIGPVVSGGIIAYRPVARIEDFPVGYTQSQGPGWQRLEREGGDRIFAWASGPQTLKPLVFPPVSVPWQARMRPDGGVDFAESVPDEAPLAVIGVRACDLAALALLDRQFLDPARCDPGYRARRRRLLLIGADCTHGSATCFCVSTGDGPALEDGYDIGLSELDEGFLLFPGSEQGRRVLGGLKMHDASPEQLERASEAVMEVASGQTRALPSRRLAKELFAELDHRRWQHVAERCLACASCTSVCPTCFCFSELPWTELTGGRAEQVREWSSCFFGDHGAVRGIVVRRDICARYRQWVTHKLGGWHRQFGRSGCVGCGRCIAWCPAGIDITEEVSAICRGGRDG